MTLKIETTTTAAAAQHAALTVADPAQVFSLLDQLRGRTLDAGTAELVAQLTAELRNPAARPARTTSIELRSSDEFHEGFVYNVEELSARLKSEGKAELAISYTRGHGGSTMHLALSGAPAAVEAAERELNAAARGAVDELRWN